MTYKIVTIVEGHGEVEAVPIIVRRFANDNGHFSGYTIVDPIRVSADKFRRDISEFYRVVELAARLVGDSGAVLVILDLEDECPATVAPELLSNLRALRPDIDFSLTLAYREFETWFLASASSIAGRRGLPTDLENHPAPEDPRDAKSWLADRMPRAYEPRLDQPAFAAIFDMEQARSVDSFDKLCRELERIFAQAFPMVEFRSEK